MNHYVYRITNIKINKHYYGTRTSKSREPQEDIGIYYFSSSSNKEFIKDQKDNPFKYKYKIIGIFNTREKALRLEVKLHNKFNVGVNESFYNKVKQTSTSFDTTGRRRTKEEILKREKKNKGLNSSQLGAIKGNNTLRNTIINGKTALDIKIEKGVKTKNKKINGKTIHQISSEKGVKTKELKSKRFNILHINGDTYKEDVLLKDVIKISQALPKCSKLNYLGKSNITKSRLNKLNKLDKIGLYCIEVLD